MKTPHKRSILSAVLQQTILQGQILLHVQGLGVPSCCHGQAATFSPPQPNFLPPQETEPRPQFTDTESNLHNRADTGDETLATNYTSCIKYYSSLYKVHEKNLGKKYA